MLRDAYVSYEEAQRLIPFFRYFKEKAPYSEIRKSAKRILGELESVRSLDYSPMRGDQIFLAETDYQFLEDVRRMG